jgi:hypothetical protein
MLFEIISNEWFITAMVLWSLPWKGVTLWKSARNKQKRWFIAALLLNTFTLLEIIYLGFYQKKKK